MDDLELYLGVRYDPLDFIIFSLRREVLSSLTPGSGQVRWRMLPSLQRPVVWTTPRTEHCRAASHPSPKNRRWPTYDPPFQLASSAHSPDENGKNKIYKVFYRTYFLVGCVYFFFAPRRSSVPAARASTRPTHRRMHAHCSNSTRLNRSDNRDEE